MKIINAKYCNSEKIYKYDMGVISPRKKVAPFLLSADGLRQRIVCLSWEVSRDALGGNLIHGDNRSSPHHMSWCFTLEGYLVDSPPNTLVSGDPPA